MIGTAMAWEDGALRPGYALLALLAALLVQIGTNLFNDFADFRKGTDTEDRAGPLRVTQAGLIPPMRVRNAAFVAFGLAACIGGIAAMRGGLPILLIMAAAIASGILYTAGSHPLGYVGAADLFVLIFFGPVAVGGTYYIQALGITGTVVLAGLAPGLISTAILAVNNLRDRDTDALAGKRTLAVRFGTRFARFEFLFSIIAACLIAVAVTALAGKPFYAAACVLTVVLAVRSIRDVLFHSPGSSHLNKTLAATGRFLLVFSVVLSVAWVASP